MVLWHECPTGVDSQSRFIPSMIATAGSVVLEDLLHGDETRVWGDSAYASQKQVHKEMVPRSRYFTKKKDSRYRKLTEKEY